MARILILFLLISAGLEAKVHFINRGVKYHIGDNRYALSEDKEFVDTYPVVGQQWIQAFRVTESDKVKVRIDQIWGVDDCPYCKVIVSISDWDMGRLTLANNHEPFDTLDPLALKVEPGKTYLLTIASYGDEKVDDFVIEGVSVETNQAEVVFLKPGPVVKMPEMPMPEFTAPEQAPVVEGGCPGMRLTDAWTLGRGQKADTLEIAPDKPVGLAKLSRGEAIEFFLQSRPEGEADAVSRSVALESAGGGFVVSLDNGGAFLHGNVKVEGDYRAARFKASAFRPGQWNRLRLGICPEGKMKLWINGAEMGADVKAGQGPQFISISTLGLSTALAAAHKF